MRSDKRWDLERRGLRRCQSCVARIHAIMRRSAADPGPVLSSGDLVIKGRLKRAEVAGKRVPLTTREYQLLELLAGRQGSTLTKEMILNQMYGGMDEPELKIIDVYICKLRKKLAEVSRGKVRSGLGGCGR